MPKACTQPIKSRREGSGTKRLVSAVQAPRAKSSTRRGFLSLATGAAATGTALPARAARAASARASMHPDAELIGLCDAEARVNLLHARVGNDWTSAEVELSRQRVDRICELQGVTDAGHLAKLRAFGAFAPDYLEVHEELLNAPDSDQQILVSLIRDILASQRRA